MYPGRMYSDCLCDILMKLPVNNENKEFGQGLLQFLDRVERNQERIRPDIDLKAVWQDFESNGRTVDLKPQIEIRASWCRSETFPLSQVAGRPLRNECSIPDRINKPRVQNQVSMQPENQPGFSWWDESFAPSSRAGPLSHELSIQDQINELYMKNQFYIEPEIDLRASRDRGEAFASSPSAGHHPDEISIQDQISKQYFQNQADDILTQQLIAENLLQREAIQIQLEELSARNSYDKPIVPEQFQQELLSKQWQQGDLNNYIQQLAIDNQIELLLACYNLMSLEPKKLHYLPPSSALPKKIRHRKRFPDGNNMKQPECVFCKNNNESITLIRDHTVRDANGKVTCPILRTFICPTCGETGDNAHTMKYCPKKPVITMHDTELAEKRRIITEVIRANTNAC